MSTDHVEPEPSNDPANRKSFWEHLADLRKALIRSTIAVGLAVVVCLLLDDHLISILEYPLRRIDMFEKPKPTVSFKIGDTKLGPYPIKPEQFAGLPPGTAPRVVFQLGTAQIGSEQVVTVKLEPLADDSASLRVRLHNFSPPEAFVIAFHVALYGALILAAPFWIYFLGGFILPALHVHERRLLFQWGAWSLFLFLFGVLTTYFILLPVALRASIMYSNLLHFEALDWRADEYINFVCKFLFGMGLGFQFPLVILLTVKLGFVTHQQLSHYRRHVIVLCFILGAVLTTPEVITMFAMAIPLYVLYEICIWIAWYWERKKRRATPTLAA